MSADLGLYIHWPFCLSKCPYCDFNSHVASAIDHDEWQKAMLADLQQTARQLEASFYGRRPLSSIFIGGGTPSLMPPSLLQKLLESADDLFGFTDDIEITAEANPTSVETAKLTDFRSAGVNRISLGVQALDDQALAFLGRTHGADDAIAALQVARQLFERVSIDLIYGRQGQNPDQWHSELQQALSFGLDHLSLYQLTIEPGTVFHTRYRKGEALNLPDDDMAVLYDITEAEMLAHHMPCYEISNYAKSGSESRHNLIYWRSQDWLAIGPGATGRLTIKTDKDGLARTQTVKRKSPAGYLSQMADCGHSIASQETESGTPVLEEIMMMGLRLSEGVPLSRLTQLCDLSDWPFSDDVLAPFIEAEWLEKTNTHLKATYEGRLRLNYLLQALLA